MTTKEVEDLLVEDGWFFHKQKGSHRHYKHPTKKGKVTIPFKGPKDLGKGTIASILRQAGLK